MANVCGNCILKDLPMCTEIDCNEVEIIQAKHEKMITEQGVKSFAKFLIDKGISEFDMPDLVAEFLEKGE